MNALLLHVPKGFASEDWRHNYVNIMPMGLCSIAHHANARGHGVKVMNAAVYGDREAALRIALDRIAGAGAEVVGLPLHWHLSGYDVCWAAARIKRELPRCRVVLGGITASVFARELLAECAAVDAVVRGDGELPFAAYLDELARPEASRDLSRVPNLCWRRDGQVALNDLTYVALPDELSSFDFSPDGVMHDLAEYTAGPSLFAVMRGERFAFAAERTADKAFFLSLGRGCSLSCVYCAGSRSSFARYFRRDEVAYRSVDAVLATVRDAARLGFRKLHACFDAPFPGKDDHFAALFARIRDEIPARLSLLFETYELPSRRFLDAISSGFERAIVVVSPCFFDPAKMRRYKGYSFTREQMEEALAQIRDYPNLEAFVYFAITPLEDWGDTAIEERADYMRRLSITYGCKVSAMPILAEPGSPWVSFPEQFGDPPSGLAFADFWEEWQRPLDRWSERLCRLPDVNRIVARLDALTENASLTSANVPSRLGEGG